MKQFEDNAHAFIIRIWREPRELKGAAPQWRGVIEHVASGKRIGIEDLASINAFIKQYLENMGVSSQKGWGISKWLNKRKL